MARQRARDNKVSRERKNGGGIRTGKAGEERENKEKRDEGMKERCRGGREEMMQRRSDGPRERGMEGLREYTESERKEERERQRGIVLCGSPQSQERGLIS